MAVLVHSWNEVDADALCAHARVVAFDLDNTLAVSKQPMLPDMADRFTQLTCLTPTAIITGGRWELVVSQILDVLGERANRANLHLMPTSGSSYYRWNGHTWQCEYARTLSEADRAAAIASLTRRAHEQGIWPDHPYGEPIEDRGSQITFSALGQKASAEAKRAWDPDDVKKQRLVAAVAADLPRLHVRAGGYTSVDVSEGNVDKAYAVRQLAQQVGSTPEQIVFIGDRMTPGGNDYPAAMAGAVAVHVNDPSDTVQLCDRLIRGFMKRTAAHDAR
ncbi:haloacid dehalogenase [Bifidobacterium goeldii]|uniref:phosphomannomutase n=1 Tax=Bifidobacterium goeldii TaxID=2306975 RepID=A0A430FML1_9BIFI|nr:HAD-IIB family hydrolase [Bifidobacterium goeldii]RSX53998.1 haloacid dehalogenase [Bifidobacterium goeldii]